MDPTRLPLRDVHLTAAPSWGPPAPGWWLVVAALVMTIWGINVPVPFERQAWGFAAVCGISIILTLFAFVIMRRKNMF